MGKIKLCMPYYNEDLIAKLNIREASKWVDEIHITEFDKSFKYGDHSLNFAYSNLDKVFYHEMTADGKYLPPRKYFPYIFFRPVSHWMKHYCLDTAWYNDAVSRNSSLLNSQFDDEDILILSDIDEIIDSTYANEIVDAVKKYGVVTIKIYFTNFFFNLFCKEWPGPDGYSYRIFAIKGSLLRQKYKSDSDWLRKLGENGKLVDTVRCLGAGYMGFHHSWLGNADFIKNKLMSYAHTNDCHRHNIFDDSGNVDMTRLKEAISKGYSLFDNVQLIVDNEIKLLPDVESLRFVRPDLFFTI